MKQKINSSEILKDIDKVFDLISDYEKGKISIEEATKQSDIIKKSLEKYPKNLDIKK
mgnify:CR=1 FL=1|jgi:uncharacterized membrane protein YjjP (DUF1212 family)